MWIACDSGSVYPILIEIETRTNRGSTVIAPKCIAALPTRKANCLLYSNYYEVPKRALRPRYFLVYGVEPNSHVIVDARRSEPSWRVKTSGERLMSFDRLTPAKNSVLYSCVRKSQRGYRALAVPPCLTIINTGDCYRPVEGWEEALDACPDMANGRREYLKKQLQLLTENPDAYVRNRRGTTSP
jgi:hypothetical protein